MAINSIIGIFSNVLPRKIDKQSSQLRIQPQLNSDILILNPDNRPNNTKYRGMMFHITGLPAERSACGQFNDPQTTKFINFLKESKQTHWINNPLTPLDSGLCPYSALSRFSRNKYIVNLNQLVTPEYGNLLKQSELPDDIPTTSFTLEILQKQKDPRFKIAFERFQELSETHPLKKEYNDFCQKQGNIWLDNNSIFEGISSEYDKNWKKWSEDLRFFPERVREKNLNSFDEKKQLLKETIVDKSKFENISNKIENFRFEQFLYDKQYKEFKKELDKNGIKLVVDFAYGFGVESIDVWANKNIVKLDKDLNPTQVTGAPPEDAYPYTQKWDHALWDYDKQDLWDYQEKGLRQILKEGAAIRLDHFVGYMNRATIPTEWKKQDGTVLKGGDIFKPVEQGGMGIDFFPPEWIENVFYKKNPKNGENPIDLFVRVAKEEGIKPKKIYIAEDFGPLSDTEIYQKYREKYKNTFKSQRVPITDGIGTSFEKVKNIEKSKSNPYNMEGGVKNVAVLTGNHDFPSLRQTIDDLLEKKPITTEEGSNSPALFKQFCKDQLKLTDEQLKDPLTVAKKVMKWHYKQGAKHVQTTLGDALGIYFRPNIPGFWNDMKDKWEMKTIDKGLIPLWSRQFPKDFLSRENENGINPGYKKRADEFVSMMKELYPDIKKEEIKKF